MYMYIHLTVNTEQQVSLSLNGVAVWKYETRERERIDITV